jgi:methionyl-tRNA formyltransferase
VNVLLIGEESAGIQALRALESSGHRVVGVMASPTRRSFGGISLWKMANKLGYRTWTAELVKDPTFANIIRDEGVDLTLNVHSLFIINSAVLAAPRIGSFNMHPGPLPRYAGLNTVSWAIYRGESRYGVTIHKMVPGIDAGPIAYQSFFTIDEEDTALSLSSKCVKAGIELVGELLEQASTKPEAIPLTPQDFTKREYFGTKVPHNGRLSWLCSAREIINFIRACDYFPFSSPWGHPLTKLGAQEIAILKASPTGKVCDKPPGTVGQSDDAGVHVACGDEWISVQRLVLSGRSVHAMTKLQCGDRLE